MYVLKSNSSSGPYPLLGLTYAQYTFAEDSQLDISALPFIYPIKPPTTRPDLIFPDVDAFSTVVFSAILISPAV